MNFINVYYIFQIKLWKIYFTTNDLEHGKIFIYVDLSIFKFFISILYTQIFIQNLLIYMIPAIKFIPPNKEIEAKGQKS